MLYKKTIKTIDPNKVGDDANIEFTTAFINDDGGVLIQQEDKNITLIDKESWKVVALKLGVDKCSLTKFETVKTYVLFKNMVEEKTNDMFFCFPIYISSEGSFLKIGEEICREGDWIYCDNGVHSVIKNCDICK